jgi:hypothetical protein
MQKIKVGDIVEAFFEWGPNHVQRRGYDNCWEVVRVLEVYPGYGVKAELVRDRRSKYDHTFEYVRPLTIRPN